MATDKLLSGEPSNEQSTLPGMATISAMIEPGHDKLLNEIFMARGRPFNSPAVLDRVNLIGDALERENGEPESSITRAAIHAAGFILNMNGLGATVESARVHPASRGYTGMVHYGALKKVHDAKMSIFRDSIGYLSGSAAEKHMGMWHASSNIPSKVLSSIFCRYLDKTLGKESGHFFQRALDYSESVITANRHIFNSLVFKLSNSGCISPEEAKEILKSAFHIPGAAL